ncbi:MAG: bifunctional phosphopantothenoylcysteine decarboxylase/phosphopantothenate--cysteine ligase CoaBC [Saprospiraceae bacterium]|nr:bifunctional phosphopantothenoylcysteine decarboxylase/phosphopantothenate--cysteine ligase CoaBC [Bacteroidia bacterium]NNL93651.1 bifunctional phosphopantothenoylcysteine decarboxylase/phosphopantothenate--cysteine ligase CoaBC [Saprospiraceae bacterium]
MLKGKKIILAVSGSIAAYKSAHLVRGFIKKGAEVKVLMTPAATAFISPLTFSTLSKNKVHTSVIDGDSWDNHVELGLWADALVIAPATANTIAKMANGICDNIISAVYLSAKCPVFIAPAMDLDMWAHPSTTNNIQKLISYGNTIIDVEEGELASGLVGKGRMAEPENIIELLSSFFLSNNDLKGKKVLITAGPTYEAIDPVRFIGNHSSGKMGVSLAEECLKRGAEVHLVLGPSSITQINGSIHTKRVKSGEEMFLQCDAIHDAMDICIFAAAVADYRPTNVSTEKIKKDGDSLELSLEKTRDIADTLGKKKQKDQIHIGFALETKDEAFYAKKKLEKKNFNMIVLNSLKDKGAGFKHSTNKITIYTENGEEIKFDLKLKTEVAADIVNTLVNKYVIKTDKN